MADTILEAAVEIAKDRLDVDVPDGRGIQRHSEAHDRGGEPRACGDGGGGGGTKQVIGEAFSGSEWG